MELDDVDGFLHSTTQSERWHLEHPDELSKRYDAISQVEYEGRQVYVFDFFNALGDNSIWLMKESRFAPIPLHIHDVIELNYIYSGTCTQVIDGTEAILRAGEFCLFDCNTPHEVARPGEDDIIITIDMRKTFLARDLLQRLASNEILTSFLTQSLMTNMSTKRHIIFHGRDERADALMRQLICDYYSQASSEVMSSYMVILFSHLMRIYGSQSVEDVSHASGTFVEILHYIDQNPGATLESVAERFGYNASYLGTLIKERTGQTYRELTLAKRMKSAALWLTTTDAPIYEIAEGLGYKNLGFFYRKFRETYGCTPQEYRDLAHRQGQWEQ